MPVPERRAGDIPPLPARADEGASRRQQRLVFEQVKAQVLDTATRYFDESLRILKHWMNQ
jgi:hypothetical protein